MGTPLKTPTPELGHQLAHQHVWGMTHTTWGYAIWGLAVLAIVFGLELPSKDLLGLAPWPSLSYTIRKIITDHAILALLLLFLLETFIIHIFKRIQKWGV